MQAEEKNSISKDYRIYLNLFEQNKNQAFDEILNI